MDEKSKKCLMRWHEYSDSVTVAVQTLRYHEELLDVTIACDGKTIRAHKLVLAACSQYFRQVFKEYPCEHPTIILDGITWKDLVCILQFMYCGLVLVEEEAVCSLLAAAYTLDVVGLNYVTAALLEDKCNYIKKDAIEDDANEDEVTKLKCDEVDVKPEEVEVKLPNALNLSTQAQNQTCINKDIPTRSLHNNNNIPSNENSVSSEPNSFSLADSERMHSAFNPHLVASKHYVDCDTLNQPSSKRAKTDCENNHPHVQKSQSQDSDEEVPNGAPYSGCAKGAFELEDKTDQEDSKRFQHLQEKILSERRLNEENCRDDSASPVLRVASYPLVNGDSSSCMKYDDLDSLDNELSQDGSSMDNTDTDMGPAPLPLNHPAVLASSKSAAAVSAAAAALAVAANGGSMSPTMNYAAYLAANSKGLMNSCSGMDSFSSLHNAPSPSGMSLPIWMPPTNNTSPSPSPPGAGSVPPGFIHSSGMSQQDLQATLEQYQRKLAFHEPRPCPTCRRMYRDAATLRTHIAIMHSEGKEPFACTCGALFRTKYDMYQHKKSGHR